MNAIVLLPGKRPLDFAVVVMENLKCLAGEEMAQCGGIIAVDAEETGLKQEPTQK